MVRRVMGKRKVYTQEEYLMVALQRYLLEVERQWDKTNATEILDDTREFVGEERGTRYDGNNFNQVRADITRVLTNIKVIR